MSILTLALLLYLVTPAGATIDETTAETDPQTNVLTFGLHFSAVPDFRLDPTTLTVRDSFRLTILENNQPVSVVRGDEIHYDLGLPIHNPNDPDPLVPGAWRGTIRYSLSPDNILSFSAHLGLFGLSTSTFSYTIDGYQAGLLAQSYGCVAGVAPVTCVPTVAQIPAPPKPYTACRIPGYAIVVRRLP